MPNLTGAQIYTPLGVHSYDEQVGGAMGGYN